MPSTKSRVHPKYKTKYRVGNWSDYDRTLVERGNLTIWLSPVVSENRIVCQQNELNRPLESR